jgi:hypothetical protein
MSEPHRNILSVERLCRDALSLDDPDQLERALHEVTADAVLLEWNDRNPAEGSSASDAPRGLFAVLGAAARQQRVVFPARWLPVRPDGSPHGPAARLLAFARSDAALQHLFANSTAGEVGLSSRGLSRPDEPLILLGIEGDALMEVAGSDASEFRRRAEQWIQRLGADRIVLAVPSDAGPQHPLVELARQRALPVFRVGAVGWARANVEGANRAREVSADLPLLWTDFQLDTEHRLPDDSCIPGLRDLIHRGALLRERTLYDRLPPDWRTRVDAELRALYAWHVSPLLRRVSAGLQLLDAVEGVQIGAPMPQLRSVTAWLLGLTDQRPHAGVLASEDPVSSARRLAQALQDCDRVLRVRISTADWPRLHARMAGWAEGGFLARTADPNHPAAQLQYCFSGLPLTHRTPLRRGMDGIDLVELGSLDLDELGWLRIECNIEESPRTSTPGAPTIPVFFDHPAADGAPQLALDFEAEPFRQERSA